MNYIRGNDDTKIGERLREITGIKWGFCSEGYYSYNPEKEPIYRISFTYQEPLGEKVSVKEWKKLIGMNDSISNYEIY